MIKRSILKKHSKVIDMSKRILDIFFVIFSGYLAYKHIFGMSTQISWIYMTCIIAGALLATLFFHVFPLYHSWRGITLLTEYKIVLFAWVTQCFVLVNIGFMLNLSAIYSREWLIEWFLAGLFLLLLYRFCVRVMLSHYRRLNFNQRTICLIAYGSYAENVYKDIIMKPEFGFRIIAVFSNNTLNDIFKDKLIGKISNCSKWLKENEVDQVWIAVPLEKIGIVKKIVYEMRHKTVDIRLLPDLTSFNLINHSIAEIAGMPFVNLSVSPMQDNVNRLAKRCEDMIIGTLILILISPILIIISIIIRLTSQGPVFYKQIRVGWNNKPFTIFKFRTMPVDIEDKTGATWAKAGDKRTTSFGSFLRKTSLDELPQFINVLKGEMSVVGPRPERPEFFELFKEEVPSYMKKHMVKAGITGWAQINGWRGNTNLTKRIEYDIYYIENWSLLFDLKIFLLTFIKGFVNKNAY